MAVAVPMTNPITGQIAFGYQGFSWTTLFFGVFPALFRGHFVAFVVMFILAVVTYGLSWLVFPFLYNGWHWNSLIKRGFVPNTLLQSQQAATVQASASVQHVINVNLHGPIAPGSIATTIVPVAQSDQTTPQLAETKTVPPLIEHTRQRSS